MCSSAVASPAAKEQGAERRPQIRIPTTGPAAWLRAKPFGNLGPAHLHRPRRLAEGEAVTLHYSSSIFFISGL